MPDKKDGGSKGQSLPKKVSGWDVVKPYAGEITLEKLIEQPPFMESRDRGGSPNTCSCRVPEWIMRKIEELQEVKRTPYKLQSDVMRDCIFIGLQVLSLRYEDTPDWGIEIGMTVLIGNATEGKRIEDRVKDLMEGIDNLLDGDDEGRAVYLLDKVIMVAGRTEDQWKRSKWLRMLRSNKTINALLPQCSPEARNIMKVK